MYGVLINHYPSRAETLLASPSVFPSHKAVILFAYGRPITVEQEEMLGMYLNAHEDESAQQPSFMWLPEVVANFGVNFRRPQYIDGGMDDDEE